MNQLTEGRLLAVSCGLKAIKAYLKSLIALAAINTPECCTLSGPVEAIESFEVLTAVSWPVTKRITCKQSIVFKRFLKPMSSNLPAMLLESQLFRM